MKIKTYAEIDKLFREFKNRPGDELELYTQVAAILLEKSPDSITLGEAEKAAQFNFELPTEKKAPRFIRVNGKRYAVILDFKELNGGNVAEIDSFTSEPEKIFERLHLIMASITRDTKGQVFIQRIEDNERLWSARAANLLDMDIGEAWAITLFFYRLGINIAADTVKSGQNPSKLKQVKKSNKQRLMKA